MPIQLPNWDLGLWDYLGFKSISYCTQCYIGGEGEVHNCCVHWASRIVKYNVNKGSIACKSLLYEGDSDCRISSYVVSQDKMKNVFFVISFLLIYITDQSNVCIICDPCAKYKCEKWTIPNSPGCCIWNSVNRYYLCGVFSTMGPYTIHILWVSALVVGMWVSIYLNLILIYRATQVNKRQIKQKSDNTSSKLKKHTSAYYVVSQDKIKNVFFVISFLLIYITDQSNVCIICDPCAKYKWKKWTIPNSAGCCIWNSLNRYYLCGVFWSMGPYTIHILWVSAPVVGMWVSIYLNLILIYRATQVNKRQIKQKSDNTSSKLKKHTSAYYVVSQDKMKNVFFVISFLLIYITDQSNVCIICDPCAKYKCKKWTIPNSAGCCIWNSVNWYYLCGVFSTMGPYTIHILSVSALVVGMWVSIYLNIIFIYRATQVDKRQIKQKSDNTSSKLKKHTSAYYVVSQDKMKNVFFVISFLLIYITDQSNVCIICDPCAKYKCKKWTIPNSAGCCIWNSVNWYYLCGVFSTMGPYTIHILWVSALVVGMWVSIYLNIILIYRATQVNKRQIKQKSDNTSSKLKKHTSAYYVVSQDKMKNVFFVISFLLIYITDQSNVCIICDPCAKYKWKKWTIPNSAGCCIWNSVNRYDLCGVFSTMGPDTIHILWVSALVVGMWVSIYLNIIFIYRATQVDKRQIKQKSDNTSSKLKKHTSAYYVVSQDKMKNVFFVISFLLIYITDQSNVCIICDPCAKHKCKKWTIPNSAGCCIWNSVNWYYLCGVFSTMGPYTIHILWVSALVVGMWVSIYLNIIFIYRATQVDKRQIKQKSDNTSSKLKKHTSAYYVVSQDKMKNVFFVISFLLIYITDQSNVCIICDPCAKYKCKKWTIPNSAGCCIWNSLNRYYLCGVFWSMGPYTIHILWVSALVVGMWVSIYLNLILIYRATQVNKRQIKQKSDNTSSKLKKTHKCLLRGESR